MFTKKLLLITCVLISVIALAVLAGCSSQPQTSSTGMQVLIQDAANKPLSGAKVVSQVQPDGQLKLDGITIQDGTITFNGIKAGHYQFSVSRFDYQPIFIDIDIPEGRTISFSIPLQASPVPTVVPIPSAS
jgi:hypothetical protein